MNLDTCTRVPNGSGPSQGPYEAYEPSITSSTSSSQSSVFSDHSANSSIATSVSDDFRSSHDDPREQDRICAQPQLQYQARTGQGKHTDLNPAVAAHIVRTSTVAPSYADVTSLASAHTASQRPHPRRSSVSKDRQPPQLVRQRDRKIDFVDNLVDSATQMVEVIWPLSVVPCQAEGSGRGVLPLRTYIEETLRRSRTSYSTLQVALYYLILIRPVVPSTNFIMEQASSCPVSRALMCGRRMFLSALILASKYLQDRNYSAKAWSKMSGLKISEINTNERTFLEKVNWRLHIPKPTFEKWQEVVLRYTPRPATPGAALNGCSLTWRKIVPMLTPELDTIPMPKDTPTPEVPESAGFVGPSPATTPTPTAASATPYISSEASQESTPTPAAVLPRFLEPKTDLVPPTPALARMGPLPTPQMTPSTAAPNTPAASVCGSRRPSISSAMSMIHKASLSRCSVDTFGNGELRNALSRRSSLMSVASASSSPESMVSDRPRTASRASSASSISSVSSLAPQRALLARQATCRNFRLMQPSPLREVLEEGSAAKPIVLDDDVEMTASPDFADFTVSEKALRAPHRHSKHFQLSKPTVAPGERSRKRCRSYGHGRSDVGDEISSQLEDYHAEEMEVDENDVAQSEAVSYARHLLSRSSPDDFTVPGSERPHQSPSPLSNRVTVRIVPRGNKRSCVDIDDASFVRPCYYGAVA